MGYTVNLGRTEPTNSLVMAIPVLRDNINELRQWTVRQSSGQCPSPTSPPQITTPIEKEEVKAEVEVSVPKVKPLPIPNINLNTTVKLEEEESFDPPTLIDGFGFGVPFDIDAPVPTLELDLL